MRANTCVALFASLAFIGVGRADDSFRTLIGHTDIVYSVAVTPDGQTVVSGGSADATIRLWQISDGAPFRTINQAGWVICVAVTPNGQTILSGLGDNTVKLWNVADGALSGQLFGHTDDVAAIAVTPDGLTAISGSNDATVKTWRLSDRQLLQTLTGHTGTVRALAVTPDGHTLASGSTDNTIKIWRLSDGQLLRTLTGHTGALNSLAVTPDGETLVSSGADQTIKIWRLSDGELLRTLTGHAATVTSVALTPDGQTIVSGSDDNLIKVWRLADGTLLRTLSGHTGYVATVAITPDGQTIVSGSGDHTIKFWRLQSWVSGTITTTTWTAANSPYRVTGTITVPTGNTLTIEPGVDVLFDADVQFIVQGSLHAVGTETDSIRFLKGLAAQWGGLRISGGDSSTLAFGRISGANGGSGDGGGLYLSGVGTRAGVFNSAISGNAAYNAGGAGIWNGAALFMVDCTLSGNSADPAGGAGGATNTCFGAHLTMNNCSVFGNSAAGGAGVHNYQATAILRECAVFRNVATTSNSGGLGNNGGTMTVTNCAVYGNSAAGYGGGLANDNSATTTVKNSVFWSNAPAQQITSNSGTVAATYSDIQGGYAGTGNIDADPLFVNAVEGDFHLQAASPCINTGDPASPLDPDGTRADMGALPFWHVRAALPVLQTWPGTSILVPVRVSKITLFGAALAFLADSSRVVPDTTGGQAFIRSHAFQGKPSVQTDWNMVGDTVFVSLSSTEAVDLSEDVLVELAFKVKPDTPADTVALAWLPFPATNLNEMEAATIDGQITTIIYGDVSHDEAVTAQDASLILQFTVHKLAAIDEKTADVTANGFVSPTDAALVLIRVLNPSYRFPVEGGAMPKPAATLPRTLAWERDGTGWALVVSDASGILAGTLECDLPTDARVEITGGDAVDWTQDGSRLTVGFVRVSTGSATLLRLDGSDGAPVLRSAEFNEGAIPLSVPQPIRLSLAQNAPNPFNPATTIRFALPREGSIRLAVYDVNGRLVRTLVGRTFLSGHHEVVWDGCDDNGRAVASGVYVYRLTTDQGQIVRRMVLAR